jgi:hypothetical protein
VAGILSGGLLILPDTYGRILLGDTWEGASRIMPILGIEAGCIMAWVAFRAVSETVGAYKSLTRVRYSYVTLYLSCTTIAAIVIGDVQAVVVAMTLSGGFAAVLSFRNALKNLKGSDQHGLVDCHRDL